jgi:hypothetical protein
MDYLKLKSETQETYKNDSKSTLKLIIFLTKILKNIHTKGFFFISTMIIPFTVATFYFLESKNISIVFVAIAAHFISYKIIIGRYGKTLEETYKEQECIQNTLEEML